MMPSINLDAQWLRDFATATSVCDSCQIISYGKSNEEQARLIAIAQRLESMDERLVNLQNQPGEQRTYADGYRDGQARLISRSNFPAEQARELDEGEAIFAGMKITKVPTGKSGLTEAKPRKPVKPSPLGDIKLDLAFLLKKEQTDE